MTCLFDRTTMTKPLRIALIWMLMLALPAQSMAAIAMQLCDVAYRSGAVSLDSSQVRAHHPGAMSMAHHAAASGQTSDTVQQVDNSLCSLCAFCVGAVALSSVVISNSPLQAGEPSLARLD